MLFDVAYPPSLLDNDVLPWALVVVLCIALVAVVVALIVVMSKKKKGD
ncbi:MAG: hypothetical protein Q4B99_05345 [Clostridia bacterium]|nr:hypothetical protein [Clostridia bacterium]